MIKKDKRSRSTPIMIILEKRMVWLIIMFALFPLILYYPNTKPTELLVYDTDSLLSVGGGHKRMRRTRVLLAKIRHV